MVKGRENLRQQEDSYNMWMVKSPESENIGNENKL